MGAATHPRHAAARPGLWLLLALLGLPQIVPRRLLCGLLRRLTPGPIRPSSPDKSFTTTTSEPQADPVEQGGAWAPGQHCVGDVVTWAGVRLVCTCAHVSPSHAQHPWINGEQLKIQQAAALWTPDGDVEAAKLKVAVIDQREAWTERLRGLALVAAGEAKAA